jgi:hypothetical protein
MHACETLIHAAVSRCDLAPVVGKEGIVVRPPVHVLGWAPQRVVARVGVGVEVLRVQILAAARKQHAMFACVCVRACVCVCVGGGGGAKN